ncbi:serine hydrolase domain-containing protein [Paenibacillus marinisediminis]
MEEKPLDKSLEQYLNECESKFPVGGAIVISKNSNVIYAKGFGKARLGEDAIDFTPDTLVSIQSVSKSFAAASIMKLVEDNLVSLDAPLVDYLPYFQTTDKSISDQITVKQLLSHTTGLPGDLAIGNLITPNRQEFTAFDTLKSQFGITDDDLERIHTPEDVTRYLRNVTLECEPGKKWSYCTDGYIVVADLFEKVSGMRWNDYLENELVPNLNLDRTTLNYKKVMQDSNSASYYTNNGDAFVNIVRPDAHMDVFSTPFPINPIGAPMGFIYSTANDLTTYLSSYMQEESFLTKESISAMTESIGKIDDDGSYGLGWATWNNNGYKVVEHGGGFIGVSCNISMVPTAGISIVVVSNHDQTPAYLICKDIVDILLADS